MLFDHYHLLGIVETVAFDLVEVETGRKFQTSIIFTIEDEAVGASGILLVN